MDVTLVLTHRCNLACTYCFAGEHHGAEMAEPVRERALDLLYIDGADVAQLSFFGGEPFLAFAAMRAAAAGARRRAAAAGARLVLQATTNGTALGREQVDWVVGNGVNVCVSIDGVREAHELSRPQRGGQSSFDAAVRGLAALVEAGAAPDVSMVITPATAGLLAGSVEWLWECGVERVRANLDVRAAWTAEQRALLREQLLDVAAELVRRRRDGAPVTFAPLAEGLAEVLGDEPLEAKRPQVVVGTSGHLYPCSPMVGEDRDAGPEAELRLGHVAEPGAAIVSRVFSQGLHCSRKSDCACANYLETGDPDHVGPIGDGWRRMCIEVGVAAGRTLRADQRADAEPTRLAAGLLAGAPAVAAPRELEPTRKPRSRALAAALAGAGAIGLVAASAPRLLRVVHQKRACPDPAAAVAQADPGMDDAFAGLREVATGSVASTAEAAVLARVAAKAAQTTAKKPPTPRPIPRPVAIRGGIH